MGEEKIRLDIAIQCGVNKLELSINGKDDLNLAIEALELMYKKVATITTMGGSDERT